MASSVATQLPSSPSKPSTKSPPEPQTDTTSGVQNWSPWLSSWIPTDITLAERDILFFSTVLKVLLFPSYRSTDFEVHRNWLAITYTLPISKWYYDTTSEWTLDYPPFFAYFEKLLSIPAALIDHRIVDVNNLNYNAWSVVAYQRSTVILTELVLGVALLRFVRGAEHPSVQRIISASLFLHPGFLIVDHIHFQYNGFMFGILLWSLLVARDGNKLTSGFLFAVLLNFKHIYMYLAPAYFVYLLRSFCLSPNYEIKPMHFISLANTVIGVFLVSLGPFALMGQLPQLLSRLFPFTRGLNHAYWAPNIWALVTFADRILLQIAKRLRIPLDINNAGVASTSRGLVGDTVFSILPNVNPLHTFAITIVFQTIFLSKLWLNPTYKSFIAALTLCGYSSYMFGWHVHEKAILLVLVPLSLLAADSHAHFRTFVIASISGIFSLFPLLFTPAETLIKVVYSVLWVAFVLPPLHKIVYRFPRSLLGVIIDRFEMLYLAGFPLLQLFTSLFPIIASHKNNKISETLPDTESSNRTDVGVLPDIIQDTSAPTMEFLPLMITSVYCAIGLLWSFLRLSYIYIRSADM